MGKEVREKNVHSSVEQSYCLRNTLGNLKFCQRYLGQFYWFYFSKSLQTRRPDGSGGEFDGHDAGSLTRQDRNIPNESNTFEPSSERCSIVG